MSEARFRWQRGLLRRIWWSERGESGANCCPPARNHSVVVDGLGLGTDLVDRRAVYTNTLEYDCPYKLHAVPLAPGI